MRTTWYKSKDWNGVCDICGFKRKASQMQERWDGLMVCMPTVKAGCWEVRHPQDLIRPIPDQPALPWTRPEGNDVFIGPEYSLVFCTVEGQYSQADYGTADCMTVDNVNGGLIE